MRSLAKWIWLLVALAFVGGFLLVETSGLLGRTPLTPTTAAAVNGREILYTDWQNSVQQTVSQQQQQAGRTLSQDDVRRIENDVFDQMVMDILLQQEYKRRGIVVTDDEIVQYAREYPPPALRSAPDLQTNGQFDLAKYQKFLASSFAKQQNIYGYLEQYFRSEIPREKLFDQLAMGLYVPDADLWRAWRDSHDSVQVTAVAFRGQPDSTSLKGISDGDLRRYFDAHKDEYRRKGRAVLSLLLIPKEISAADSGSAREKALALRKEIAGGAKFEDVANRESADSAQGKNGGFLGRGGRNRFVPEFEVAAYKLRPGELSEPVLTQFGYHIIKVDERKGDTLALRHILVPIVAGDSTASRIDRRADSLANLAASAEDPAKFDAAASTLKLTPYRVSAQEDQPAIFGSRIIPSVSAWAFSGVTAKQSSDLFDDDNGYYLARLDSLFPGGEPDFESVKNEIRFKLAMERKVDALLPDATKFAAEAKASGLEAAAKAHNMAPITTQMFTRSAFVNGLGQSPEAIGSAFALPVGAIGSPVKSADGVYVIRVDKRVTADSAAWAGQKLIQRQQQLSTLRQQRVQLFLQDLRENAKVDDRRKQIYAAQRRQAI